VTVKGEETGPVAAGHTFNFDMQVGADVDQASLATKIRSEVTKAMQAA